MMRLHPSFAVFGFVVGWQTTAWPADTTASDDSNAPMVEVEVNGERPSDPAKTGASVTEMSRQQVEALPGGDSQPLSRVLATQPGFVADTFGFGLHVRGADGGLLYVVDGIPLLAAPLGQWGATVGFVPTRMVESLRILTGGFPAEYGSGLGAVIEINTRRPLDQPTGEAQLIYGSYGLYDVSLNYSQAIGKLNFFAGGDFQTSNRGFDPPSVSPILHDGMIAGSGFARVDYDVDERNRLEFLSSFNQSRYQIPIDPTVLPLSAAPPDTIRGPDAYGNDPPPFVPYNANPVEVERNLFATATYVHTGNKAMLQVAPFIRESYGNLTCDPAGSLGSSADPGASCSDVRRDVFHEGALVSVTGHPIAGHTWKVGALADFARSQVNYAAYFRNDGSPLGGPDPTQTLLGRDTTDTLLAGAFAQDKIAIGKWTILPGLRLDIERANYKHSDAPPLFLLGPSTRLGISYAVTSSLVVHAFVGYLWQPPSTIDAPVAARILIPSLAGQSLPVDLKAEKDWTAELGVSNRLSRELTLGLTGWGREAIDQLDRVNVGTTNLVASYNFRRGRAAGIEASGSVRVGDLLDGFANVGLQMAQGQGISSAQYLFPPEALADNRWVMLDHVQTWTANVGFDLHDAERESHLSGLINYGSGMRTGPDSDKTVPSHVTLDLTLRHRFGIPLQPEVAFDVFNVFNDVYAYRIATGYVGSAYGPPRRVNVRLVIPFGS